MSTPPNSEAPATPAPRRMTRRNFLRVLGIGTGTLAVGLVVGFPTLRREFQLAVNQAFTSGGAPTGSLPEMPFIWIQIDPDNTTHLHLPKSEMGQGIHTTLAQIAAEDLALEWDTIRTYTADTNTGFDAFTSFTFGSVSTLGMYQPMRQIAANLRQMLLTDAALQLDVPVTELEAHKSRIMVKNQPERSLTYGEIVAAHVGEWTLPETPPVLKANADFEFIGKPMQRVDLREKVTGRAMYGFDARMDGMLYGAVARPPRYGARLVSAKPGTAESQPGVRAVVIKDGFAGIVAETRSQAYAAVAFLDVTWEGGSTWSQQDLENFMLIPAEGGTLVQRVGDLDGVFNTAANIIQAEYSIPMASHAHLEPEAALVYVQPDTVIVYAATQGPTYTRDAVAEAIGVDASKINVIPTYLGGGFGRKLGTNASSEAAILSQASGVPVHVGWSRNEEMRYGYHRPPARNQLRGILNDAGQIVALQHQIASGDIFFGTGTIPAFVGDILGADPLALSNLMYDIPHRQVLFHRKKLQIPTGSWRGLGTMPNTFAVESFIDELAHQAGVNPLQMRLNHLPDSDYGRRMRAILEAVTQAANWDAAPPANHAYGLAAGQLGATVIAIVAEVSAQNGTFRVHRVWCAADPGLVVNPDGARSQIEGTIIMALSSVLHEKITIEDGMISATNFGQYPLITMGDVPEINVLFVESSDAPIGGLGEAVIGIVPAAIGNALFTLTGQRLRDLPFQLA
jgi:isoquinoline 1-oxidoreductase beta subunit